MNKWITTTTYGNAEFFGHITHNEDGSFKYLIGYNGTVTSPPEMILEGEAATLEEAKTLIEAEMEELAGK